MNTGNALGFLIFGFVMAILPTMEPQWFPATGFDGSSARALWLELMSFVQGAVGGSYLISRWLVPAVVRAAAYLPQRRPVPAGAMLPAGSQVRAG